jgi:hypothetical protein
MDRALLQEFRDAFFDKITRKRPVINSAPGRFPKKELFLTLNGCKEFFATKYGCEVRSRWSVGKSDEPRDTEIIEFLVDYSISRFSIPQAIRQPKPKLTELVGEQKYGMLLAVESELGDETEVARDFLKLLDVKAPVKLLFHRGNMKLDSLYARLTWVLSHHCCYDPEESILLIGLPVAQTAALVADEFVVRCVENGTIGPL